MSNELYWKGWPKKCPYVDDLAWSFNAGMSYLRRIAPLYKPGGRPGIVIFDLDDTLFMDDPESVVGVTEGSIGEQPDPRQGNKMVEVFFLPPNKHIIQLAIEAKKLGFKIWCLTARPKDSYLASMYNLDILKIPYDSLIMNDKDEDPYFKVKLRKEILAKQNCDIVLTVGDQFTDLFLPGGNTGVIKLPEPDLKCAYAYFPK